MLNSPTRRHVCRATATLGSFSLNGGTFTFADLLQTPHFCVHFDHQARLASFTVKDAGGAVVGEAFHIDYLARNSTTPGGFFAFPWDGTVTNGGVTTTLPDATYTVVITVLKALGDPLDPAHSETHTLTNSVTIDRP